MKVLVSTTSHAAKLAAELLSIKLEEFARKKSKVVVGFPGGRSIELVLKNLPQKTLRSSLWKKVEVFLVDERVVELQSRERNILVLRKYLANNSSIHEFIPKTEKEDFGASRYYAELRSVKDGFDIVVLSAGEDGHVASLFPNHASIKSQKTGYIAVKNSPKKPRNRISASRKLLMQSRYAIGLFLGESKLEAFERFLDRSLKLEDCPAKLIYGIKNGSVFVGF